MKKFKDFAKIILVLSMSMFLLSCSNLTKPKTNEVATPTFSLRTGTYEGKQYVEIKCTTKGATILYTRDGSIPNASSQIYGWPVLVDRRTTITAQAFKNDWLESEVSSASYIILGGGGD